MTSLLTGALGILGTLVGQAAPPVVDASGGEFVTPKGERLKLLGVCRIDTEGIECWKSDGSPNADLTRQMEIQYSPPRFADIQFQPGRKHRYPVFLRPSSLFALPTDAAGKGMPIVDHRDGEQSLQWSRTTLEPDAKTFDAFLTLSNLRALPSAELPLTKGSKLNYQGARFEVQNIQSSPNGFVNNHFIYGYLPPGNLKPGKGWTVMMSQKSEGVSPVDFRFTLLGKDGTPIGFVDPQGLPVSDTAYLQAMAELNAQRRDGEAAAAFAPATFNPLSFSYENLTGLTTYGTNVDPSRVKVVRVTGNERARVRFGGLPADPK